MRQASRFRPRGRGYTANARSWQRREFGMRLRFVAVVGVVSVAALLGGGMMQALADETEHGHGFNCTHGNTVTDRLGDPDQGNGHDCLAAAPLVTTTTVAPTVTPAAASLSPAAVAASPATVAASPAAVRVQPRLTG